MPIMFCLWDPFTFGTTVFCQDGDKKSSLFSGNFEEVCEYIAQEWQHGKYSKVILGGIGADGMKERIRTYAITNYNNFNIEIEVLK